MFGDVFDMLFGCSHKNYSFPITAKKGSSNHSHAGRTRHGDLCCLSGLRQGVSLRLEPDEGLSAESEKAKRLAAHGGAGHRVRKVA